MKDNLLSVFGERDGEKRRQVIAKIWATDGIFIDPDGPHVGHAALDEAIDQLLQKTPGFVFTELGAVDEIPGAGRLAWGFGPPGLPPAVTGLDVVVLADGRIRALYTFIDPVEK
jgi:hypothetical protein